MERKTIDLSGPVEERQEKVTSYLHQEMEDASIEEILKGLIDGNGMIEIVSCLDMIAQEYERRIILFSNKKGREYPHPAVTDAPVVTESSPPIPPEPGFPNTTVEVKGITPPLKPVDHVYKGGFFKNRHKLSWRADIIGKALVELFKIEKNNTVIDVGCAIGDYVKWFNDHDVCSWGIEGSAAAKEFMVTELHSIWDLRLPLNMGPISNGSGYDLAISLEVAEHIEPEFAGVYLDNLCLLSDTILMTAAHPGQKGHGHVNCQEKGWWAAEMQNRGYRRDYHMERRWQELLKPACHRKEVNVYSKNVMIFKKYHLGG